MLKRIFNKTLLQIFLALFLVLCLMFVSNYAIFRSSMKFMNKQTDENNRLVVNGIIQSLEDVFKELNNIIYSFSSLPYQVYDPQEHENVNMHNAYLFINNAADLISQDYIEDYVVFFKDSNLVLTSKGTESFKSVFSNRFKNSQYAPEYWRNFAATMHQQLIIPASEYIDETLSGNIYSRTLIGVVGSNKITNNGINIVVFVNLQKLYKRVNQQSMMKGSSLMVLDQDKNTIISTDNNYDMNALQGVYFNTDRETVFQKGKYEYYSVLSDYNGFAYVNKVPNSYEDNISAMKFNKYIMLLTTIMGIIISLFLSLYLYRPVKKILELIGIGEEDIKKNQYTHIYNSIKKMQSENSLIKNRMDMMEDEVRRSVFFKMIDDITYYKNLKEQIETYFNVILSSEKFLMVSFLIDNNIIGDVQHQNLIPDEMAAAIQKAMKEKVESSVVFYAEHMQFIALIGFQAPIKREVIVKNIQEVVDNLKSTALKNLSVLVAVSKYYTEVQHCKDAFGDIKLCFAYRNIRNMNTVIDIEKIEYNYDLYMPMDFDEKLSNYIISGNTEESLKLINDVIDKNLEKNINYIKLENIVNDIFNSIIKVLAFYGQDRNEIISIEKEFSYKLNNLSNTKDIKSFLIRLINRTTDQIRLRDQSKLNKEFIIQYIHLHYTEELYLDKISEVTGTTPKYFSNYFKKTFGINYIEYLNRLRMSHAKDLLKNSDTPISEIGGRIGYSNSSTFATTFKKYCGISPTEYRKEYKV